MHGRPGVVIEGYETAGEAAERLGITHKYLVQLAARGLIPGAKQVDAGRRYWYVPVDCDPLYSRLMRHAARCDCCGIILTRSGDDKHANDRPDAGRCWSCREEYGLGPLAPEIVMDGGDL